MSQPEAADGHVSHDALLKEDEMADEKEAPRRPSRRDFVKGAAAVAGFGALASCAPAATPAPTPAPGETAPAVPTCPPAARCATPWLPEAWDEEADVVVIGYGGAGAVTAITAHDAGADILILEKTPGGLMPDRLGTGGSTTMAGGVIFCPTNATAGAEHIYACSWGTTPMSMCEAFANVAANIPEWFEEMGVPFEDRGPRADYPALPGGTEIHQLRTENRGAGLWLVLDQQIQSRNIPVLFDTPATQLIQDAITKEILGVKAQREGAEIHVKAKKAVVLCTGGYEFDETMKANNLRTYAMHYVSWPYATGDGIRMAQQVGAGLWHMNSQCGGACFWFPERTVAWAAGQPGSSFVYVDKYGRRFVDDTKRSKYNHSFAQKLGEFNFDVPEYERVPTFYVFDDEARMAGPLGNVTHGLNAIPAEVGGVGDLTWSDDNSAEITRGWIQRGDTIADLVAAINNTEYVGYIDPDTDERIVVPVTMDPAVLEETVAKYNEYCAAGEDPEFGRDPSTLVPIEVAPFYAIPLWPGTWSTQGGPIRNEDSQVCDPWGNPIARLYSNGELGSLWGFLYPIGGGDLSELISFGQIAGKHAAGLDPWD
jgi:succinate dehydrogenase/fumarate reductase flavoprotein subunit